MLRPLKPHVRGSQQPGGVEHSKALERKHPQRQAADLQHQGEHPERGQGDGGEAQGEPRVLAQVHLSQALNRNYDQHDTQRHVEQQ